MPSDRDLRISVILAAMDKASGPMREIRNASRQMRQDINQTTSTLHKLEKAQSDLNQFRQLKAGLRSTGQELDQARERATRLGKELAGVEHPTKRMTAEFRRAKEEAAALERKLEEQTRQLSDSRKRLSDAGISTRNLAADERRLAEQVQKTNEHLKQQRQRLREVESSAPRRMEEHRAAQMADRDIEERRRRRSERLNEGFSVVGAATTAAATATGVQALKDAASFEQRMTSIAQKANVSRAQAQRMGEILLEISPQVARLPDETADALDSLAGLGLFNNVSEDPVKRARQIEAALRSMIPPIGRAATAYQADMNDVTRATFAATQNLQIPVEQASKVLDMMAAADNIGAFGLGDMAAEFPALTAAMQGLGQKGTAAVADLTAALEVAVTGAGSASEAANNVANLLNKINSKETVANFKNFGIDLPAALKRAYREGKTPLEAIIELTNKALKGDMSRMSYLFNDAQVQAALRPLIQRNEEFKRIRAEIGKSEGIVDRAFNERSQDLSTRWDAMTAAFKAKLTRTGDDIKGYVLPVIDAATKEFGMSREQEQVVGARRQRALRESWVGTLGAALLPGYGTYRELMRQQDAVIAAKRPDLARQIGIPTTSAAAATESRPGLLERLTMLLIPQYAAQREFARRMQAQPKPQQTAKVPAAPTPPAQRPPAGPAPVRGQAAAQGSESFFSRLAALLLPGFATQQAVRQRLNANQAAAAPRAAPQGRSIAQDAAKEEAAAQQTRARIDAIQARINAQAQRAATDGRTIGANMIFGIIAGLQAGMPSLNAAATSVAARTAAVMRQRLQIRSPSRVTRQIGAFVTEGLALGIDQGAERPLQRARLLSRRLVAVLAAGAASPALALEPPAMPPQWGARPELPALRQEVEGQRRPLPDLPPALQSVRLLPPRYVPRLQASQDVGVRPSVELPKLEPLQARLQLRAPTLPALPPAVQRVTLDRSTEDFRSAPRKTAAERIEAIAVPFRSALDRGASDRAEAPTGNARPQSASVAQPPASSNHYEIHIHQAPGQDAQDVVRILRAELDRRDREAAAARRSLYRDDV